MTSPAETSTGNPKPTKNEIPTEESINFIFDCCRTCKLSDMIFQSYNVKESSNQNKTSKAFEK
jgi:hypothetical protein